MPAVRRGSLAALVGLLALQAGLAGCAVSGRGENSAFADTRAGLFDQPSVAFYSSDEAVAEGKNQFRERNYGKAEAAFRKAVELAPNDAEAWLGLAASYDRLRRFDLADRAYGQAARFIGNRPEYYNNLGYSYLLRGDLVTARQYFLKAYELDPSNPSVADNLALLRNSIDFPVR